MEVPPLHPADRPAAEIEAACTFVARTLARAVGDASAAVGASLAPKLVALYDGHWHPTAPLRGSGYRCLSESAGRLHPALAAALTEAGVNGNEMAAASNTLGGLTIWVDPGEVSFRCGVQGGITTIFTAPPAPAPASPPRRRANSDAGSPRSLSPTARPFAPSPTTGRRAAPAPAAPEPPAPPAAADAKPAANAKPAADVKPAAGAKQEPSPPAPRRRHGRPRSPRSSPGRSGRSSPRSPRSRKGSRRSNVVVTVVG